jgi:hypothetical protein
VIRISSEFIFYDGARRIVDVVAAPIYDKDAAQQLTPEEIEETGQESGDGTDGKTANTSFEQLRLSADAATGEGGQYYGGTALLLAREYVWDPDPAFADVDRLIAYYDGEDRDTPWWVVQDHVGDVVAIVEGERAFPPRPARLVWSGVYDAFGEIAWQRWPVLETRPPPLAVDARGLFVERLDAPPVMWSVTEGGYVGDERLAPGGDHLILARNRAYQPRWGRFLQPDPNGTGVAVQPGLGWGGDHANGALDVPPPFASLDGPGGWTRDGVNVHAYCAGDPVNRSDPTGLFFGGLGGLMMTGLDAAQTHVDNLKAQQMGLRTFFGLYNMIENYSFQQEVAVDWAVQWDLPDDELWQGADSGDTLESAAGESGPAVAVSALGPGGGRSQLRGVSRHVYEARAKQFERLKPSIWRKEARRNPHLYSEDNLKRMMAGKAPRDAHGRPFHIHHNRPLKYGGRNTWGNYSILTAEQHRSSFGDLHRYRSPKDWAPPDRLLPGRPVRRVPVRR